MDERKATPATVLTIAGSDSGGAAGLQADLKTFTALGVYGMSVVTVVTAQNSVQVDDVHPVPGALVAAQLSAVLSDYGADAVKTGFIGRADLIALIARHLRAYRDQHDLSIVVDPVLVNHRGEAMFSPAVTGAYRRFLLPLADLLAPNRREAALLAGITITTTDQMVTAAQQLHALGAASVLITGGREGDEMVDIFYDGDMLARLPTPWIATENTHGSGDTLSAAVAALLAQGQPLPAAVATAQAFAARAIATAVHWRLGAGHGPLNHLHA